MSENNGQLLLTEKDFVEVKDAEGNPLPSVPKHWGADQLPPGAKKVKSSGKSAPKSAPAPSGDEPAGNASREAWATFATTVKEAKPEDLLDADGNELGRDELRAKYGTPTES